MKKFLNREVEKNLYVRTCILCEEQTDDIGHAICRDCRKKLLKLMREEEQ